MTSIARLGAALLLCCLAPACQYDESNLCGDNQELDEDTGGCRCVADAVLEDRLCHLCPEGEVVVDNACACPDDQVRGEGGACVDKPATLGEACNGADLTCDDPAYPRCQIDDAGSGDGYCTSEGCGDNGECDGGFTCATWESPSYCERPPTGLGTACADQNECAAFEAYVCFPITGECVTELCDLELNDCPVGYSCCDLSAFDPSVTTLCVPDSFSCPG